MNLQWIVIALAASWLLSACSQSTQPSSKAPQAAAEMHDGTQAHADEAEHAGRTVIPLKIAIDSGIRVAPAVSGTIADEDEVQGLLTPVDGRIAQAVARFPGPVRYLRANVGDRVRAGQPLASIESNLSLTNYSVSAPISGVITARNAQVGGAMGEGAPLFEIADLSTLWVDLHIFGRDTQHITAGVPVTVTRMTDGVSETTTLERVLPGTATASQSAVARAVLHNRDGLWRPGAAVKARIAVANTPAALVVPLAALQMMEGREVVFIRTGEDTYTAHAVDLGARDASHAEVLSGISAGDAVVVAQSYVVKADISKGSAEHEH